MAKTSAQLKTEALSILTGMDPNQEPESEELTAIGNYLAPLVEQLAEDGICVVQDVEDIPDSWFLPLARLLANVAGPRFGSPMNEDAKMIDERTLRRLTAAPPTYEPLRVEYF
jgi:hypothetical protein